jgi:flagellar biosynthesis protein FlhG
MASGPDDPPSTEVVLFREPDEPPDEAPEPVAREGAPVRILSVCGAKGGVGKSVLAANIAVYLASIGRRVVIADADADGANLHTILGIPRGPRASVARLLETTVPGLRLYYAGFDEPSAGEQQRSRRKKLEEDLRSLDADYVVVDLGSGNSSSLLDFHIGADLSVFVTLPEPTAIENTYRFVRHAFVRHLRRRVSAPAASRALSATIRDLGGAPAPLDLWRRLEDDGDPLADSVREWMESFSPCMVLNESRLRADLELGEAIRSASRRRLGVSIDYLGHIDYDDTVWSCVRMRRLLLIESPGTKSAKSIEKIARRMLAIESGKARRRNLRVVPPESHHDLLEVDRGATDEEIRRAFKRMKEIYSADSLCGYGLFTPEELAKVRTRLEEAYDVLLDPARRRPYELSVFPMEEDEHEAQPSAERKRGDLPPAPEITPDTEFNGSLIRRVRESQGIELRDVSARTKVGLAYLRAIEDEDFAALPAPVYVRGFVAELAKVLRLDASQVSRTYVKRFKRYLEERGANA